MRVLIVDDEVFIREGLRSLIDWGEAGFNEVQDAKNAVEAMEMIERARPDLILTDIFMPEMSGLEFARKIRERHPSIRFVILTGYEKFEYAKEAIEIGVAKYLVKPIFPEELLETVEELRREIVRERLDRNRNEAARTRLNAYRPLIAEKFWSDVLSGALVIPAEIRARAEAADIAVEGRVFSCAVVEIRELEKVFERYGEHELPLVRFVLRNILEELLGPHVVRISDYSDTILMCVLSGRLPAERWKETAAAIERTLKIGVGIGIGHTSGDVGTVRAASLEALDSVKYLAMLERAGVIAYDEIPVWQKDHVAYPYEEEKLLLETMRYRDRVEDDALDPFVDKIISQNPSPEIGRLAFVQLLGALYRLADEYGVDTLPTFNQSASRLNEQISYLQVRRMFLELLREIAFRRSSRHASFVGQLVEGAKAIIRARYADPGLTVAAIAQALGISPNYLSRIFHQQTGSTCVEFMTECRLEEARKLLLLSTLKNYEIAEKVGYANAHYFSAIFKKNMGVSPTEYRDQAGGGTR